MKRLKIALIGFFFVTAAFANAPLVPGSEDVPLMSGLEINQQDSFVFDTPSGKLVEAFLYSSSIKMQDVKIYYEASLPQLGWKKIADNFYERDGEKMKITFDHISEKLIVRFTIAPTGVNIGRN